MNYILLLLTLLCTIVGFGQDTNTILFKSDTIFKEISTDSLHISLTTFGKLQKSKTANEYVLWEGTYIPKSLKHEMNLESNVSHALGKIIFDSGKKTVGYILGCNDLKVLLYVYSLENKNLIFKIELASYNYLEAVYEKIRNSWIIDLNSDGNLEVAIWEKQIDFELPNALSNNSSTHKKFIYSFIDTNFKYQEWPNGTLKNGVLKK